VSPVKTWLYDGETKDAHGDPGACRLRKLWAQSVWGRARVKKVGGTISPTSPSSRDHLEEAEWAKPRGP